MLHHVIVNPDPKRSSNVAVAVCDWAEHDREYCRPLQGNLGCTNMCHRAQDNYYLYMYETLSVCLSTSPHIHKYIEYIGIWGSFFCNVFEREQVIEGTRAKERECVYVRKGERKGEIEKEII